MTRKSNPHAKEIPSSLRLGMLLIALALPLSAQAFPFIAAGGGAVVLPYLIAMLASLLRSKAWIVAATVSVLGGYWLMCAPYDYVADTYSFEENRLAGMLGDRVHTIRNVRMTALDLSKGVGYDDLLTTTSKVLFVNDGGLSWRNGYEAEFILSNQRMLPKDSILVTGEAQLGETLANATGVRWLKGGLVGVLRDYAQRSSSSPFDSTECPAARPCAKIGVMGVGFFMRFSGFPYKSKDWMLDLHELMLPGGGIDVLKRFQEQGQHISIELYDFPNGGMDKGLFNFLQAHGIHDLSVHYYDEQVKTKGNIEALASRFGGSNKHLDLSDIDFLCENDAAFVMAFDGKMNTSMLFPETLRDNCEAIFLPVEGMLPQQIEQYVKNHPLPGNRRFVGIYTDKSTAFYTKMLLGILTEQGYPVVGITSLDKEHIYVGNMVKATIDAGLLFLSDHISEDGGRPDSAWVYGFFAGLFLLSTLVFLQARRRISVIGAWSANLGVMVLANFFARYIPNNLDVDVFEACLWICVVQWGLLLVCKRRGGVQSKSDGIFWLRSLGLATPKTTVIRSLSVWQYRKMMRRYKGTVIFRSNASGENLGARDSGRFESVVATSELDFSRVVNAWEQMLDEGRRPSFVVQPHIDFDYMGAVSSIRDEHGQIGYILESSSYAQAVTSGVSLPTKMEHLSRETAIASDEDLHQQVLKIHKAIQGHFIAEYGIADGQVVWLQFMRQPTILCSHKSFFEEGYVRSPMTEQVDIRHPWNLSFLRGCAVGRNYLQHQGALWERQSRFGAWLQGMAPYIPWRALEWLVRLNASMLGREWFGDMSAQLAFMVDQVAVSKGLSDKAVSDPMSIRYAQSFGSSEILLHGQRERRQMLDLYQAKSQGLLSQSKINHCTAIRDRCRELIQVVSASRWGNVGFWPDLVIEPSLESDPSVVCRGSRGMGSMLLGGLEGLDAAHDAIIKLERADLSVFAHQERIACIRLPYRPSFNSHFVQRCLAYGIRVEVAE